MIRAGAEVRDTLIRAADRALLHNMSGDSRTGQQIVENVDCLAGALIEHGCLGRKVGLWYQNSLSAVEAFLAVEWIGGTRVPVDPGAPQAEAEAIFEAAGVDVVLTDRDGAAKLTRRSLVHEDNQPLCGTPTWPATVVDPDQTHLLLPRAVNHGQLFAIPVSYGNWRETMRTNISLYQLGRYGAWLGDEECFLAAQQIMHGTGFVGTFPFLEMGLPQVLATSFDPTQILDAVERHRVTSTVLVPPMLIRLTHAASQRPGSASSLRHVMYGGGVVRPDDIRRSMQYLGSVLVQGYGRIEGGWPLTILDLEDHHAIAEGDDALAASCGRPIDGVVLKLRPINNAAADCGELCVASKMTVKEYTGPDGWCSLGDLVRIDENGYVFYQGRLDRMINTGYHIYPDEVEEAIAHVPEVSAVRVVGEANGGGQTIVAYIVSTVGVSNNDVTTRVKHELAARLARYKIPSQFRFVKNLPEG